MLEQEVKIIPRAVLFGDPEKSNPKISPDGKFLAYLSPFNGVRNVFVRALGKEDDRPVTLDGKRGIRNFFWGFDNQHIMYLQDEEGDENWHLFQTNLETGMTRDLTPIDGIQAQVVSYQPDFPDTMLVGLNSRDKQFHDVYRLNLHDGTLDLDTTNTVKAAAFVADNNLLVRVAQRMTPDGGTEILYRKEAGESLETLLTWGSDETFGGVIGFDQENHRLRLVSSVDANASRFIEIDPETMELTVLGHDPVYDVGDIMVNPVNRRVEAITFIRERAEMEILDPSIEADFAAIKQIRDGDFFVASRDLADENWIVTFVVDDGPLYFYLYNRITTVGTLLFTNQPKLESYQLAKSIPITFKARDGLEIHGYLLLPPGREPKALPLVLRVHGGPYGRDYWGFEPEQHWLANRGYAVLMVNFRGSLGYGKAFLNAGDREWGGKMHEDLIDAKAWAVKEGYADPKKVAIMGTSYGGYATLAGLTFTPGEFVCGVDVVGPSSLVTMMRSLPPYWTAVKAMLEKRIGYVETEEEFLKSRSPLYHASKIVDPLLVAQGANDPRCKKAESDQIVEAIRNNGRIVEYLVFPDEGHVFIRPENRAKFYAAAEAFLAKNLGGRVEPPGLDESWEDVLC